ncbi:MAG: hypothetical protein ACM3JD_01685, partial [Rudaea sp.]
MKNLFRGLKDRPWLLPLVFSSGLLLGLLVGRIVSRSPAGDLLTGLALLTVGLAVAVLLIAIGWLLAADRAPDEISARPALPGQMPTVGPGLPSLSPVGSSAAPAGVVEGTERLPAEDAAFATASVSPGRADRQFVLGVRHIPGYDSVQIKVGYDRDWFGRVSSPAGRTAAMQSAAQTFRRAETLPWLLFAGSLLVYALTRLFALDQFPINFFADEAIQVTNAVDLVNRGF